MRRLAAASSSSRFAALAAPAGAHPLGNFSINHIAEVSRLRRPRRRALRARPGRDPDVPGARASRAPRCSRASRPRCCGGCASPPTAGRSRCAPGTPTLALRPGAGGLQTTRFELAAERRGARAGRVDGARRHLPRPRRLAARSSRGPAAAPRCARACPPTDPTDGLAPLPEGRPLRAPPTSATRASRCAPGDGTVSAPGADAQAAGSSRRHPAGDRRRRLRGHLRRRRRRPRRADPAAARRVRLGRGARALARPRQGDGGRLPRRHARDRPRTPSRSAPP